MEKGYVIAFVVLLGILILFDLGAYLTGSLTLNPQIGSSTPKRDSENANIIINPNNVNAGGIVTADIYPGKEGVYTGLAVYSEGGKRKWGNLCQNQGSADFCSNTYECIDELPERCQTGTKCFGAKRVNVRTSQNWASGRYYVKVCEAVDECWKCKEPVTASFFVE